MLECTAADASSGLRMSTDVTYSSNLSVLDISADSFDSWALQGLELPLPTDLSLHGAYELEDSDCASESPAIARFSTLLLRSKCILQTLGLHSLSRSSKATFDFIASHPSISKLTLYKFDFGELDETFERLTINHRNTPIAPNNPFPFFSVALTR